MGKAQNFSVFFFALFCNVCNIDAFADVQTLCSKGSYIAKCGDYSVGTNWLKGYSKTGTKTYTDGTTTKEITFTQKTPNYFDYSDNANEVNLMNLKKFFDGISDISYTQGSISTEERIQKTEFPGTANGRVGYVPVRDEILSTFCNPNDVTIKCAKCPGNGTVEESTFNTTLSKWEHFNTIASCYMTEYTDFTGTFIYVQDTSDQEKVNCYFIDDFTFVGGSILGNQ